MKKPVSPLKSIHLSDLAFAARLSGKYGWNRGQAWHKDGLVHRMPLKKRRASAPVTPIHLHFSRTQSAFPLKQWIQKQYVYQTTIDTRISSLFQQLRETKKYTANTWRENERIQSILSLISDANGRVAQNERGLSPGLLTRVRFSDDSKTKWTVAGDKKNWMSAYQQNDSFRHPLVQTINTIHLPLHDQNRAHPQVAVQPIRNQLHDQLLDAARSTRERLQSVDFSPPVQVQRRSLHVTDEQKLMYVLGRRQSTEWVSKQVEVLRQATRILIDGSRLQTTLTPLSVKHLTLPVWEQVGNRHAAKVMSNWFLQETAMLRLVATPKEKALQPRSTRLTQQTQRKENQNHQFVHVTKRTDERMDRSEIRIISRVLHKQINEEQLAQRIAQRNVKSTERTEANEIRKIARVLHQQINEEQLVQRIAQRKVNSTERIGTNETRKMARVLHKQINEEQLIQRIAQRNVKSSERNEANETREIARVLHQQINEEQLVQRIAQRKVNSTERIGTNETRKMARVLHKQINEERLVQSITQRNVNSTERIGTNETRKMARVLHRQINEEQLVQRIAQRSVKSSERTEANETRKIARILKRQLNEEQLIRRITQRNLNSTKHTDTNETRKTAKVLHRQLNEEYLLLRIAQHTANTAERTRISDARRSHQVLYSLLNKDRLLNRIIQHSTDKSEITNQFRLFAEATTQIRNIHRLIVSHKPVPYENNPFTDADQLSTATQHRFIRNQALPTRLHRALHTASKHRPDSLVESAQSVPTTVRSPLPDEPHREITSFAHRQIKHTNVRSEVTAKEQTSRPVPLDVLIKAAPKTDTQSEVIQSMEKAIKSVEHELKQAKLQFEKPNVDLKQITDQLYTEFSRRIRLEQQRRGL